MMAFILSECVSDLSVFSQVTATVTAAPRLANFYGAAPLPKWGHALFLVSFVFLSVFCLFGDMQVEREA